jgi:hypothetical protein
MSKKISIATGIKAAAKHLQGAVLFYNGHPANGGKPGYVLVVKLRHPLAKGQHIIGRVGDTFPITAVDKAHACYFGGVRGFGPTKKVRYGGTYRVRIWIGTHPDPDLVAPTSSFNARLHHASTGKDRARTRLQCGDPSGFLK